VTEVGTRVRTNLDLLADDGSLLPIHSLATVIGFEGERLILALEGEDEDRTVTCERWEVRRTGERVSA
jgi:hypothetical protein